MSANVWCFLLGIALALAAPYAAHAGYRHMSTRRVTTRGIWLAASFLGHALGWVLALSGVNAAFDLQIWQTWYFAATSTACVAVYSLAFSLVTFRELERRASPSASSSRRGDRSREDQGHIARRP